MKDLIKKLSELCYQAKHYDITGFTSQMGFAFSHKAKGIMLFYTLAEICSAGKCTSQ